MSVALELGAITLFAMVLAAAAAPPSTTSAVPLRVGFCTDDLARAKAVGFDYAEIGVRDFAKLSDADFETLAAAHQATQLPTLAGYVFLPTDLKIVGPEADPERVMAYVSRALARSQRLGVKIIVFGSPAARRAPEGFPREQAFAQLVALGKRMALVAEKHGVVLAAEPIRRQETNMINTVAEGLAWAEGVGHPSFQFMVDLYHLVEEGEDPEVLRKAGPRLAYAKLANPKGRVFPLPGDGYDYGPFLRALRAAGYSGPIGMETPADRLESDGPRSIAFLREAWAAAGRAAPRQRGTRASTRSGREIGDRSRLPVRTNRTAIVGSHRVVDHLSDPVAAQIVRVAEAGPRTAASETARATSWFGTQLIRRVQILGARQALISVFVIARCGYCFAQRSPGANCLDPVSALVVLEQLAEGLDDEARIAL